MLASILITLKDNKPLKAKLTVSRAVIKQNDNSSTEDTPLKWHHFI